MRSFGLALAPLAVVLAALVACEPVAYGTRARFGPPGLVLDADQPERSYRVRVCYAGNAGDHPWATLGVRASSPTPMRASVFVDDDDNQPETITATDLADAVGRSALWLDDEIDDACETGVIVSFALLDAADPNASPVEITWQVEAYVYSFEEQDAESLTLEVDIEALD